MRAQIADWDGLRHCLAGCDDLYRRCVLGKETLESWARRNRYDWTQVRACWLMVSKVKPPSIHRRAAILMRDWGLGDEDISEMLALPEERGGGLVVAVIRDADRKSLRWISEETRTLAEKARSKGLSVEDMADSTFTISNLGMFGVEHFTAVINPPNSAILACGAAIAQPVVRDGVLAVGHEMQATLSLDHRVIDGATGAAWLGSLKRLLEHPALLMV